MNKEIMDAFIQKANLMENGEQISEMAGNYHIIVRKNESGYHCTIWFANNSRPMYDNHFSTALNMEAALKRLHYIYFR